MKLEQGLRNEKEGVDVDVSRRRFLQNIGALLLAPSVNVVKAEYPITQAEQELRATIERVLHIQIRYTDTPALAERYAEYSKSSHIKQQYEGQSLLPDERVYHTQIIATALMVYPSAMIHRMAGECFPFVVSHNINSTNGIANEIPLAMYSGRGETARIDINATGIKQMRDQIADADTAVRRVLHHELFHRLDLMLYGEDNPMEFSIRDTEEVAQWRALQREHNGPPFFDVLPLSVRETILAQLYQSTDDLTRREIILRELHGFLGDYSREHPIEDRAEIAGLLLSDPMAVMQTAQSDALFREKVDIIKLELWHASGGIMDEEYWEVFAQGDILRIAHYVREREHVNKEE